MTQRVVINCLFGRAEQSDGSQAFEEGEESWAQNSPRNNRNAVTPPAGKFPMHNGTNVQFEAPKVPVIFVLGKNYPLTRTDHRFWGTRVCVCCSGGPGSGKVTHCDNLMQEKNGVTHINMTDLLQQYAIGNGEYLWTWVARPQIKLEINETKPSEATVDIPNS